MVQIKNGNVPIGDQTVGTDQHCQANSKPHDRLRDLVEGEKYDQIEQAAIALQLLMTPPQPLVIGSKMSGVTEKTHRAGRKIPLGTGVVAPGKDGGSGLVQLRTRLEHLQESSARSLNMESKSSAILTAPAALAPSIPTPPSVATPAATAQSEGQKTSVVAERRQGKNTNEDIPQIRGELTEKLFRDSLTAAVQPENMRNAGARPAMPTLGVNAAAHEDSETGWVYNFRSWGKQHAVRITPSSSNQHLPMTVSSVSLQPLSTLVEQRLLDHGGMVMHGDNWRLKEHDEHRQQQQNSQRQADKNDEDEA